MSLPKAQLVDPKGNMNLPGMTATGIVTATSLSGVATGSVTNLTGSPDLDVGIVTGSSFVGDGTGHAASLTGTPQLSLGIATATSFIGDATGKAAGLTGTPNLNVGLITATSFVGFVTGDVTGNISGLAVSVTPGVNLGLGVCTAIQYHGDGSGLTGAGSSVYIAQEITASGDETIIDLSDGNLIYYKGQADTTIGFASTSPAEQITFIRDTSSTFDVAFNESISTGGVNFDNAGDDERLTLAGTADFHFGTNDFTIEAFVNRTADTNNYPRICNFGAYYSSNDSNGLLFDDTDYPNKITFFSYRNANQGTVPSNARVLVSNSSVTTGTWYHVAVTRTSGVFRLFINGVLEDTNSSIPGRDLEDSATNTLAIAGATDRMETEPFNGKISNFRIINGTSLYTKTFLPPSAELANVTNTKLLCCQSTSSATASVVTPGTITADNSPTAGAQTVTYSGTNIIANGTITWPDRVRWNNGITPTLTQTDFSASQLFRFTSGDTGLTYNAWEELVTGTTYKLFGWGNAVPTGQIGDNSRVAKSSPTQVGTDTNWSSLSNGHMYRDVSVAFKNNEIYCWGNNSFGALGQNDLTIRSSPTQIPGTWSAGAALRKAVLATKPDGTAWVWGHNEYGVLGMNVANDVDKRSSPTQLGTNTNWGTSREKLGAGWYSSFAIKANGTLWSWGYNSDGQLGLNEAGGSKSSPTQIGTDTTWDKLSDNGYNTMAAIKTDGTLWTWGEGEKGQLGLNTGPSPRRRSSPTQVGTNTNWSNVVIGYEMCMASKTDGSMWIWGKNAEGALGQNQAEAQLAAKSSPVQIPGTTWSSTIAGGNAEFFGAVKTDGTLWTWGSNSYGSLGLNQAVPTKLSSPTQVPGTNWKRMSSGRVFLSLQAP